MTSIQSVREVINMHFQHVKDLGDGILRGERQHEGKAYAIAYIDLSDDIVERSRKLKGFQEGLLGSDFFSSDNDLRWNSYLFFWAGPRSTASKDFRSAKSEIESDRDFARKFVLDENDLKRRLGKKTVPSPRTSEGEADAGNTWAELLRTDSLATLMEQRPRTAALELIESGEAFKAEATRPSNATIVVRDALGNGFLRRLEIGQFRRAKKDRTFEFGDVNLIVGPNGTGKTSLLEAIEVLYCGRVRRDPDASFANILGVVEGTGGELVPFEATTATATLKARNMAWYGRTDVQAMAISQGFTRFNFLDTDAAFRLSSEQNKDQIQLDLAQLLVGPETSRLWTYLSKLKDDVGARLKSITEQLNATKLNVELLNEEVTRLKNVPSQSHSLLKAFRLSASKIKPKWDLPIEGSSLSPKERTPISEALNAIERALASATETPVSRRSVTRQLARARNLFNYAEQIKSDYEIALQEANSAFSQTSASVRNHLTVERWAKLVNAGVPNLQARLDSTERKVTLLRRTLRAHQADSLQAIPREYESIPLSDGLSISRQKYEQAKEQVEIATTAQFQAEQLGQTLNELRRDLHDSSKVYIERSGERELCPVCKTAHSEIELHAKLQALIASDSSQVAEGLRHGVQLSRERLEVCRRTLHTLTSLDAFRLASNENADSTPQELLAELKRLHEELRDAAVEFETAQGEAKSLELLGLEFVTWKKVRDDALPLMQDNIDVNNAGQVGIELAYLKAQVEMCEEVQAEKALAIEAGSDQARQLAAEAGLPNMRDLTPVQVCTFLDRALKKANVAFSAVEEIDSAISLNDDSSIEALQTELQACLLAFDKALQADQQEASVGSLAQKKEDELQTATKRLAIGLDAGKNLTRAMATLTTIVEKHSLDKATADSFSIIRSKVSDIFAQIHSPPEYEVGSFSGGQLIIRRDDGRPHEVNQVSTGQRAALALSIFLAMNDSASSAPPVILIDDPVAHIDDLNALSFLDYLRDVVVGGRKQVFFATADARLAALFQRKFEFLGEQRFKRVNLATA